MNLVDIRENAITVELDWADVRLLAYMLRHAVLHDVGSATAEPVATVSYADTAIAFLEAAGMASWAHTVEEEEYTLERFAEAVPITPDEERRWRERCEAVQRELARERRASSSAGKDGEAA